MLGINQPLCLWRRCPYENCMSYRHYANMTLRSHVMLLSSRRWRPAFWVTGACPQLHNVMTARVRKAESSNRKQWLQLMPNRGCSTNADLGDLESDSLNPRLDKLEPRIGEPADVSDNRRWYMLPCRCSIFRCDYGSPLQQQENKRVDFISHSCAAEDLGSALLPLKPETTSVIFFQVQPGGNWSRWQAEVFSVRAAIAKR